MRGFCGWNLFTTAKVIGWIGVISTMAEGLANCMGRSSCEWADDFSHLMYPDLDTDYLDRINWIRTLNNLFLYLNIFCVFFFYRVIVSFLYSYAVLFRSQYSNFEYYYKSISFTISDYRNIQGMLLFINALLCVELNVKEIYFAFF